MDPRVSLRSRQKPDKSILRNKFESALLDLISDYKKTETFRHAQTKGTEREVPVRALICENLPSCYAAVGGEVVDITGRSSGQLDVVVYNHHRNSSLIAGAAHILPAEAPLVTVEVKSQLNKEELKGCISSAAKLKSLRPLKHALGAPKVDGVPFDGQFRYFHCIFAFNTDLVAETWGQHEYERLKEAAVESGNSLELIDRIYVADRGLLMPSKAIFLEETATSGLALMQFVLHLRNFCLREDSRRPPADYVNYASTSTKFWKRCQ